MSAIKFMKNRNDLKLAPSWKLHLDESNSINKALGVVFEHLPYLTLCTCTIVSKTWRKTALDELQSRCTVTVNNNDQISIVLEKLKQPSTFKVGKCIIASPFTDNLLLQQMLTRVAKTLNVLKIESTDIQEAFLFRIVANLPNLTQLSVVLLQVSSKISNQDDEHQHHHCNNFPFLSGPLTNPFYSTYESKKCVSQRISDESQNTETENGCKMNENGTGTPLNKENESYVHHSIRHLHFDLGHNGRLQLSKIFRTFPNLVELNVSNIVDEPRKNFKCQQQPDSDSSSRYMKCTLKYLSIRQYSNAGYSEKLVQTLVKLGMCLAKLVLIFPPPSLPSSHKTLQVSSAPLKQFIEMQGSTLKSLKLIQVEDDLCRYNYSEWDKNTRDTPTTKHITSKNGNDANVISRAQVESKYWWNFNYSSPSFPLLSIHLPNLQVLHVQKPLITNLAQVLNHFPKLSQLSIQVSPNGAKWRSMFPQRFEAHVHVTTFKLDFIDSDSLYRLGHCFPSLQILQMSYCDERLFNTLRKLIPCFNGKAAKENLVPCERCHKKSLQGNINKDVDAVKNRPNPQENSCRQNDGRFQLLEEQCSSATGIKHMKNLKLLKVRPCHHFPYENFVFLQNGTSDTTYNMSQSFGLGKNGNTSGNGDLDSSFGFSWSSLDIMRNNEFLEFPVDFSENAESCSSA